MHKTVHFWNCQKKCFASKIHLFEKISKSGIFHCVVRAIESFLWISCDITTKFLQCLQNRFWSSKPKQRGLKTDVKVYGMNSNASPIKAMFVNLEVILVNFKSNLALSGTVEIYGSWFFLCGKRLRAKKLQFFLKFVYSTTL